MNDMVKVLVISHNCFSTYNNMGKTLLSLFSGFRREELCQLYVYPTLPDVDACNSYYRITDRDILRSFIARKVPGGQVDGKQITVGNPAALENSRDGFIYKKKERNSTAAARLLRDAMWKASHWYTGQLRQWLDRENPTCIFLAPGYAKFIYDVAMKISEAYGLPIVTYICDDFYFVKQPESFTGRCYLALLKRKTEQLMRRTGHLITICEEMKDCYAQRFSASASVIMTGAGVESAEHHSLAEPISVSYFGNLSCNRHVSLREVGTALDQINVLHGTAYRLDIYTSDDDPEMLRNFKNIHSIRLRGFVSGEAFTRAFLGSDMLLHVEAFDGESVDQVKHSVSTKIADCLASGIPLIAYGPRRIASMQHLIRNDCALAATSKQVCVQTLETAFFSREERLRIAGNAVLTAERFHRQDRNSMRLRRIFESLQTGGSADDTAAAM